MPLFEITENAIREIEQTTFDILRVHERSDLQRILRDSIGAIDPDLLVITEEFGEWEDARRRIDLLCLDRQANLVVVELKRTEEGGHMELQAIRYAAMVANLTFEKIIEVHAQYLASNGREEDAWNTISQFLGWDEETERVLGNDVRIVLVAAGFSPEITTTVLWLNERDLDIRCIRWRPYRWRGTTLLDIQQIIPLPEASDYQVKLKQKAVEKRAAEHKFNFDFSKYDLQIGNERYERLTKRALGFHVLRAAIRAGIDPEELAIHLGRSASTWFISVHDNLNAEEFAQEAYKISTRFGKYNPSRFFGEQEDLIRLDGKTCAIANQWSIKDVPALEKIAETYPQLLMRITKTAQ